MASAELHFLDVAGRRIAYRVRDGARPTLVFLPGYASDMEGTTALALVDRLTSGPLVLVGSSMGGWLVLHLAVLRPGRMQALVGIAAAPDFTDWGFADAAAAERQGLALGFWQSGQQLLLLDKEIAVDCPVRLLHGERDEEVPLDVAFRTLRALRSADVQLNVLKGGGHRLSEPHEIDAILHTVAALIEQPLEPAP